MSQKILEKLAKLNLNGNRIAPFAALPPATPLVKLDLGCGPNPREGFEGVDILSFDGKVKHVVDLRSGRWPWEDGSVAEVHASHFIEHLTNLDERYERCHVFNELYRVLADPVHEGGKPVSGFATFILPHWCSQRYYGDPTHKEPFSEFALWYLDKGWRAVNAPHADAANNPKTYSCDFLFNQWYNIHPALGPRNPEYQQNAIQWYKEAASDMAFILTKRV